MTETIQVYCEVVILMIVFIVFIQLFVKQGERLIDLIFSEHDKQMDIFGEEVDKNYSMSSVDCLNETYIRDWIQSSSSGVKCGDSVFAYLIHDEVYHKLLSEPGLFHRKRRKDKHIIVNLAVRNHNTYEFERIHSITCNSVSPELASLAHQGMWFSYDMSLVN